MPTPDAFWDQVAENYAAQPVANPEAFDRKTDITRALLTPESVVLGVGCGTGSLALRLAPHAGQVHGVDISSEMIRIARGKRDAAGADNVTFHVAPFDQTFTALDDGSVDVVCAYSILHLLPDAADALAQMFRLLKPGGTWWRRPSAPGRAGCRWAW
jgi:arsenite methyltransferase